MSKTSKIDNAAASLTEANIRLAELRDAERNLMSKLDNTRENIVMHERNREDALKVLREEL